MEKTIKNIRKKYKEIKSVETIKNQLLGVQVKNKPSSVKSSSDSSNTTQSPM
jgi:hypothetical protein